MRTNKPEVFVAANGAKLVYPAVSDYMSATYYSPEGATFYQLQDGGGSGSYCGDNIDEKRHFAVPQIGFEAVAHRTNDEVNFLGVVFTCSGEDFNTNTATIVPLPNDRQVEYLCEREDGTFVYVSASRYEYDYGTFRLFVGSGKDVREIPVSDVMRWRDGGTTNIDTPEGTFHSPSPFKTGPDGEPLAPTWKGESLKRIPKDRYNDYDIVEDETGAVTSITKR